MLHRVKKQNDLNHDKWIGVGGKCEEGESPEECVCRETLEETGLTLTDYRYRGVITFVSDIWEGEYMHLFTATGWTGTLRECSEGVLEWLHKDALAALPQWEGGQAVPGADPRAGHAVFLHEAAIRGRYAGVCRSERKGAGGMILVSACLLGCACRYDGQSKPNPLAQELARRGLAVPVCPEQLGGLPTPRNPSERRGTGW